MKRSWPLLRLISRVAKPAFRDSSTMSVASSEPITHLASSARKAETGAAATSRTSRSAATWRSTAASHPAITRTSHRPAAPRLSRGQQRGCGAEFGSSGSDMMLDAVAHADSGIPKRDDGGLKSLVPADGLRARKPRRYFCRGGAVESHLFAEATTTLPVPAGRGAARSACANCGRALPPRGACLPVGRYPRACQTGLARSLPRPSRL
jgi:hypothetical protein